MSGIDWSKAPEGHPVYIKGIDLNYASGWYKELDDRYVSERGTYYMKRDSGVFTAYRNPSPAWSGDGLPPVGAACEWEHDANKGKWHKAAINYIGSAYVIVSDFAGIEQHYYLRSMKFRPIRTQAQIEADERSKECDRMFGVILDNVPHERRSNGSDIVEALYDAGCRLPTKQDCE